MKNYIRIQAVDPLARDMRFQIIEVIQRPATEPVYQLDKRGKHILVGTRETDELVTVEKLLGHGQIPFDCEAMAMRNGYEPWQQRTTSDSKP